MEVEVPKESLLARISKAKVDATKFMRVVFHRDLFLWGSGVSSGLFWALWGFTLDATHLGVALASLAVTLFIAVKE